ncbi:MAG: hypothetical protein ACI3XR_00980 [Eubacteriales bacterium]
MKKYLSLALALAMITGTLALVSCDKSEPDTTTAGTTTSSATTSTTVTSGDPGEQDPTGEPTSGGDVVNPDAPNTVDPEAHVEGDAAVAQLVGSNVNLMEEYFGSYSAISITQGYVYDEDAPDDVKGANEAAPNLFDGDVSTKWCCPRTSAEHCSSVVWSMSQAVTATHYSFTTANDNESYTNRNPVAWRIYGTNKELTEDMAMNDDYFWLEGYEENCVPEGWELIDYVGCSDLPDLNFTECAFTIDNPTSYQYYMLLIDWCDFSGASMQISEFTLYGTAD